MKFAENTYVFTTDADVVLTVSFDIYSNLSGSTAYWLNLTNASHRPSPRDPKVRDTLICIIEEFFRQNPDILLYICDTANNMQAMRNRLFLRWFNTYELNQRYVILNEMIPDEGVENYVTIIIPRSHPKLDEITSYFEQDLPAGHARGL